MKLWFYRKEKNQKSIVREIVENDLRRSNFRQWSQMDMFFQEMLQVLPEEVWSFIEEKKTGSYPVVKEIHGGLYEYRGKTGSPGNNTGLFRDL